MQLTTDNLGQHLQRSPLLPIYLIEGDEELLVLEAVESVRQAARKQGFSEREVIYIESNKDWDDLIRVSCSMSLFSEKKIIDLRTAPEQLKKDAGEALKDYCANLSPDNLLLITTRRLDSNASKTAWYKAINGVGALVKAWPVGIAKLPNWIASRLRLRNIRFEQEAVQVMVDRVEGNLLAAAQEIDKIEILMSSGETLTAEMMNDLVADSSHFDVFGLIDAALLRRIPRVVRMLKRIETEGVEPLLVVGSIARELRTMVSLAEAVKKGQSPDSAMRAAFVWKSRIQIVGRALQRDRLHVWPNLLAECVHIDLIVKGARTGKVWNELLKLLLAMAGTDPIQDRTNK